MIADELTSSRFCGVGLLLAGLASAAGAQSYVYTDLGSLPPPFDLIASGYAINDLGAVAGTSSQGFFEGRACLFGTGAVTDLGTPAGMFSEGFGINLFGQVTGRMQVEGGGTHAYRYTSGVLEDLGALGGSSTGYKIADDGTVVGQTQTPGSSLYHAAIFEHGQIEDLETVDGFESTAFDINGLGQIVGERGPYGSSQAVRWDRTTGAQPLGDLGGYGSHAYAINSAGVAVGSADEQTDHYSRAVAYRDGQVINLGTLGGRASSALDINDNGDIVGSSDLASGHHTGFLFHGGVMTDIRSFMDPSLGFELIDAYAVNNVGQIAGIGVIGDRQTAFVLTPVPEPSIIVAMGLGVAFAVRRRRHRGPGSHCPDRQSCDHPIA